MAYCDEYLELISAAVDGALSPAEREKLDGHLALCPDCRDLYEELTAVHTALGDLPPVEVPADLTGRIMAAVAAEQVIPFEKKKAPVRWKRWLASAAVLAVVLAGTWSWKPWERTVDNLPPSGEELQQAAGVAEPEAAPAEALLEGTSRMVRGVEAPNGDMTQDRENGVVQAAEDVQSAAVTSKEVSQPVEAAPVPAPLPSGAPVDTGSDDIQPMSLLPEGDGEAMEPSSPIASYGVTGVAPLLEVPMPVSETKPEGMTEEEQGAHAALERLLEDRPEGYDWFGSLSVLYPRPEVPTPENPDCEFILSYEGLSENGKYYVFRACNLFYTDYSDGTSEPHHNSLVTYYAVPLDGGEIIEGVGADFDSLMAE